MKRISLIVEVEVNQTEDMEKVKVAVANLFPNTSTTIKKDNGNKLLVGRTEGKKGLTYFHERLRDERILNAARKVFFTQHRGEKLKFFLNKQVAYVGRISFCQPCSESPLGPIKVTIFCDNVKDLIDWLAPLTASVKKGRRDSKLRSKSK